MLPSLYRGSVKDLRGPVELGSVPAVVFDYTDAYSVFDWGRMPDLIEGKGASLAVIAADWFTRLADAATWQEFSKTTEARDLRKASRFGSAFNEVGEILQNNGLKTHFLGVFEEAGTRMNVRPAAAFTKPFHQIAVRQVSVTKPSAGLVLGRSVPDYSETRVSAAPRLVPLEVVFRFSCPSGSSLLERVKRDPEYLATLGFGEWKVEAGANWDFPVLELFTKLETSDRPLSLPEALAISGLGAVQLNDLLFKTAWVAAWLRSVCARAGLTLADGKLEWGVDGEGNCFLVDAIGPDELRILKGEVQLSKEFLREFYRRTPWYGAIGDAKNKARTEGVAEWKRLVAEGPPHLSSAYREATTQLYRSLANALTGREWFAGAWDLARVADRIAELRRGA